MKLHSWCSKWLGFSILLASGVGIGTLAVADLALAQVCPGIDTHTCATAAGGVSLDIHTAATTIGRMSTGSLDVACCESSDRSGKATCACDLNFVDPFQLTGIGFVCLSPGTDVCDTGEIDCDGGNSLDVALNSEHNIAGCASETGCETSCETHCAGLGGGFERGSSTCEGRCSLGAGVSTSDGCSNTGAACSEDADCGAGTCETISCDNDSDCLGGRGSCGGKAVCAAGGNVGQNCVRDTGTPDGCSTCTGGSIDCNTSADCPPTTICETFSCSGPVHGSICDCVCVEVVGGPASAAGALSCSLSAAIQVEVEPPCGDGDVVIEAGDACIPLTTEEASVVIAFVNNASGSLGPFSQSGVAANCDDLATSTTKGTKLVGTTVFFDTNLGDLAVETAFTCN